MVFVLVILLSTALKSGSVSLGNLTVLLVMCRSWYLRLLFLADLFHLLHGEVWRLVTSFFVFQNSAQTIVGLILLYTCRQFERQMGSKKFGAFLIFSSVISTLICIAMIVVASSIGFYLVPSSGPFALIFALMTNYFCKHA
jgi:membrane associated rhomboid family serine protease